MKFFFIICSLITSPAMLYSHETPASSSSDTNSSQGVASFVTMIQDTVPFYKDAVLSSPQRKNGMFGQSLPILEHRAQFWRVKLPDGSTMWLPPSREHKDYLKTQASREFIEALKVNAVQRKGLVLNRLAYKRNVTQIAYHNSAELVKELGKVSIFEVRFVYAETDNAILLGRSGNLMQGNAKDVLVGWFSKENIVDWNTRIALEFNKEDFANRAENCGLHHIYNAESLLKEAHPGRQVDPALIEENRDISPEYFMNRMPLLERRSLTTKSARYSDYYYKLAYIGDAYGTGEVISEQDVARAKETVSRILSNETVQIAILIDATKGMQPHIQAVKTAIKRFLDDSKQISPEIAIAVYRDFVDGDAVFKAHTPFTRNRQELYAAIDDIKAFSSPNDRDERAFPEAMFNGIHKTLGELTWKEEPGEKFILLIGDHGDHEEETPQSIGELLKQHHVSLHGVQVHISGDGTALKQYNDTFAQQVKLIKEGNDGLGSLTTVEQSSSDSTYRGLLSAVHEFEDIKEALLLARTGHFTDKLLARYGINPATFRAQQFVDIGYAFEDACNKPQFKQKVLLLKKHAEELKTATRSLSDGLLKHGDPDFEDTFRKTVYQVVKDLTGEELEGEVISEFIEKRAGIPIHTPMLKKTFVDLFRDVQGQGFREKLRKHLETCILVLEEVTGERRVIDTNWEKKDQAYTFNYGEHVPYFFNIEQPIRKRKEDKTQHSRKMYAWVPMSAIP